MVVARGRHRETVGAQRFAGEDLGRLAALGWIRSVLRQGLAGDVAEWTRRSRAGIRLAVGDVVRGVARLERIDVGGALPTDDLAVEADRRDVEDSPLGRRCRGASEVARMLSRRSGQVIRAGATAAGGAPVRGNRHLPRARAIA